MHKYARQINKCLKQLRSGDDTQMSVLFGLTANHLTLVAKKYLCDKSLAQDVVSDVYLKIYKHAQNFDCSRNGYNWLFTITKNIAFEYNEKQKKYSLSFNELYCDQTESFVDKSIMHMDIEAALKELCDCDRELIIMRFYIGLSVKEISKTTGISKVKIRRKIKMNIMVDRMVKI